MIGMLLKSFLFSAGFFTQKAKISHFGILGVAQILGVSISVLSNHTLN